MGMLRRVTDAQVKALRRLLNEGASLRQAALKTDMDRKSARKYRSGQPLPSEAHKPHTWRTRADPLAEVWPELVGRGQARGEVAAVWGPGSAPGAEPGPHTATNRQHFVGKDNCR